MKKAKVSFEYEAQEDDELNLSVGDIISEVEPADVGWCKGLLRGKRGLFPDNFVQFIEEEEKKVPPPPAANKKPSKKKKGRWIKIQFPYEAENGDEISLEVGDLIEVTKDVEEGWAEGINKGKKGVFPTNFGEFVEVSSESEESADGGLETKPEESENKQNEELATSTQKKVKGIGFGNIFGDGPIKLRQRSIGEADRKKASEKPGMEDENLSTPQAKPGAIAAVPKEKEPPKEVVHAKPKKAVSYCKVSFDYNKENDDELGLKKGEILVILNKHPGDEGWWEGEKVDNNGKRVKGVFPDNFVTELTADEVREHEKQLQGKSEIETSKEMKALKPQNKEVKKVTPLLPAPPSQGSKPMLNNNDDSEDFSFTEPSSTDHTLAQVKRPAGPKNRRKPGAAERREKAASSMIQESNGDVEVSEDEKISEPTQAPKKESTKRGVAVLPGLSGAGGDSATGETPSWLQNLKSRQSVIKKPPPAAPVEKEKTSTDPPAWLASLKKRQSSEFPEKLAAPTKEKVPLQPKPAAADRAKPAVAADKAKPVAEKRANGQAPLLPPTKLAAPKPPSKPSPSSPTLAAWQIERQQKAKKTKPNDTNEEKAPEPPEPTAASGEPAPSTIPAWKNSLNRKSPAALKSPSEPQPAPTAVVATRKLDKPPIGTPVATPVSSARVKPAPPKAKPAPAVKPASSTAVEELKAEIKEVKEEMEKLKDEMKKEISRLNYDLQNERNHRTSLEDEIHKLRQQITS